VKVLAAPVAWFHVRPLMVAFAGGDVGWWAVERLDPVVGAPLEPVPKLEVIEGTAASAVGRSPAWVLRGVTSNERCVSRSEHDALVAKQEALGREGSTRAALIPITKTDARWELPQNERCRIFEESSHDVAIGLDDVPAVARRLHHGRTSVSRSTSRPGLSSRRRTRPPSRASSVAYARRRSGPTSSVRSTSGSRAARRQT
jgi:hypothetical protein